MDGLILVPSAHEPSNCIYDGVSVVVQRTRGWRWCLFGALSHTRWTVIAKCCTLSSSQSVWWKKGGGRGPFFSSSVWGEEKGFKANSKMQDAVEVSNVGANRTRVSLLHFFPRTVAFFYFFFSPLLLLRFILCVERADRTGCAKRRRAGRLRAGALG